MNRKNIQILTLASFVIAVALFVYGQFVYGSQGSYESYCITKMNESMDKVLDFQKQENALAEKNRNVSLFWDAHQEWNSDNPAELAAVNDAFQFKQLKREADIEQNTQEEWQQDLATSKLDRESKLNAILFWTFVFFCGGVIFSTMLFITAPAKL